MSDQQIVNSSPEQNNDAEVTIDLKEVMFRLLSKWKMILCVSLALAIAAGIYTAVFVTPMYRATSTIYVISRKDSAINMADLQIGTALTQDYVEVFDMWEVHEQVISNLGLPYSYSQMRKMLKVENVKDTRMIDIHVTSPYPAEAAEIANEYASVVSQYIADTMSTDKPNVMSVALEPANPVSPNLTKNVLLGFILGFLISAGTVTVQAVSDDNYKTAEDIRTYTGLNTLAVIPLDDSTAGPGRKARRKK